MRMLLLLWLRLGLVVRMIDRGSEGGKRCRWVGAGLGHERRGGVRTEDGRDGGKYRGSSGGRIETDQVGLGEFSRLEVLHVPLTLQGVDVVEIGEQRRRGAGRLDGRERPWGRRLHQLDLGVGCDDDGLLLTRGRGAQHERLYVAEPRTQHQTLAVDVGRCRVEAGAVNRREW